MAKLKRRDWILVLSIGALVGGYAVLDLVTRDGDSGGDRGVGGFTSESSAGPAPSTRGPAPVAATPSPGEVGGAAAGMIRLRSRTVMDRTGFAQPVEAVSVLVPHGWGFESQVRWTGEGGFCSGDHAGVSWAMTSPDGNMALGSYPAILVSTWPDTFQDRGLQPTGHCHLGAVESHLQFAEEVLIPILRPGNRILEVTEITDIPEELQRMAESRTAQDALLGGRSTAAGTAVVTLTPEGRHEELLLAYYLITDLPAPSPWVPPLRMVQTFNPLVIRAPAHEPERMASLASTVLSTVRYNPAWQRAIQQVDGNLSRIQVEGAAARSRILAESFREVGEIQMSGWESRMNADWRGNRSVADALAGVGRRVDPHTGSAVTLDGLATRYFANPHGEYLMVEAPDVDPRLLFPSEDWREMVPADRPD
jgi:hypothetical protein